MGGYLTDAVLLVEENGDATAAVNASVVRKSGVNLLDILARKTGKLDCVK